MFHVKNLIVKIVFLLFFLLKCSAPQVCEKCTKTTQQEILFVCVDSAFSPSNKILVQDFSNFFTDSFCGIIQAEIVYFNELDYSDFCDVVVFRVFSDFSWIKRSTTPKNLAFVKELNGLYVWIIEDKIYDEMFVYVLAHEVLHSLGVDHGENLMKTKLIRGQPECIDRRAAISAALEIGRRRGKRTGLDTVRKF